MSPVTAKNVTIIPPKVQEKPNGLPGRKKLRVAAYCRVSSDKDEQLNSFEVQVKHYTDVITKNPNWKMAGIFADEKYKGDALLQKEFTVDFLNKKMKKNEGQVPQYYMEGNHEASISPAVFDTVQAELEKRRSGSSRYSGVSIFSNKIRCADCGGWFGSKVWQYRKVIYRCNRKYNDEKCCTPHVTEDEVKAAFVSAYNQLVTEKKEIIANAETIRRALCQTDALEEEKRALEDEMSIAAEMAQSIIAENARIALDQSEYQERYNALVGCYNTAKVRYDEVVDAIAAKAAQSERLLDFIRTMREQDGILTEFYEQLWSSMVEFITVGRAKEIVVTFRDGTEIKA